MADISQANDSRDSRLTQMLIWVSGVIGSLVVSLLVGLVVMVLGMREGIVRLQEQGKPVAQSIADLSVKMDRLEVRQNGMDIRQSAMEARQIRALQ